MHPELATAFHHDGKRAPVVIAGGGLAGLTMAALLAAEHVPCVILDRAPPLSEARDDGDDDPRASAIALGSVAMLTRAGVWPRVTEHAQPIKDILVTDEHHPARVHFPAALAEAEAMGYMIENRRLLGALRRTARESSFITWIAGAHVTALNEDQSCGAAITYRAEGDARERILFAETALAADGRQSRLRDLLGIAADKHDYGQTAVICAMRHRLPHQGLAQERFLEDGPFATLPLRDPCMSSIVWTVRRRDAQGYLGLSDVDFNDELQKRAGTLLGPVEGSSHRGGFPLTLASARTYRKGPFLLIGDAAHGVHPLAGQGYNLAVRSCADLSRRLGDARRLGSPLGDPAIGQSYERARLTDATSLIMATHGLNALFSTSFPPFRAARRLGLAVTDRLPSVKKLLMRRAMGVI